VRLLGLELLRTGAAGEQEGDAREEGHGSHGRTSYPSRARGLPLGLLPPARRGRRSKTFNVTLVRVALVALLALLVAAGCGQESVPPPPESPPSGAQAERTVESLTEDTERLAREVAGTGRRLAQDPSSVEDAQAVLEDQERRARELADRTRRELPEGEPARERLAAANERTAEAAAKLRDFAERPEQRESLEEARESLRGTREELGGAVEEARERLSPGARERLDRLREGLDRLPEL